MTKNLQLILIFMVLPTISFGQKTDLINWLNFEQLEDSLKVKPKKTLIYFYANWCVYCKKMESNAFKDPEVIGRLKANYYTVKMNAETTDTIDFEGQKFYNQQAETMRNGVHQIPLLLASRKNREFSLPAILVLDEKFNVKNRNFEYLTTDKIMELLDCN